MTSSATQDFLREIVNGDRIPDGKLAYFGSRLCGLLHQALLVEFTNAEKTSGLTKRELARRIAKKPEQLTRWLSYPGNLTLETVGEIFIGMGLEIEAISLVDRISGARIQFPHPETTAHSTLQEVTPVKAIEEDTNVVAFRQPKQTPPPLIQERGETRFGESQYSETKVGMYG